MPNITNYTIDLITANLDDYIDVGFYPSDLYYGLLETYNYDATTTYCRATAKELILKYWDDMGAISESIDANYGQGSLTSPFDNPEMFLTQAVLYVASWLLSPYDEHNGKLRMTSEMVDEIKATLEDERKDDVIGRM